MGGFFSALFHRSSPLPKTVSAGEMHKKFGFTLDTAAFMLYHTK